MGTHFRNAVVQSVPECSDHRSLGPFFFGDEVEYGGFDGVLMTAFEGKGGTLSGCRLITF